jgi:hypothetical protein
VSPRPDFLDPKQDDILTVVSSWKYVVDRRCVKRDDRRQKAEAKNKDGIL